MSTPNYDSTLSFWRAKSSRTSATPSMASTETTSTSSSRWIGAVRAVELATNASAEHSSASWPMASPPNGETATTHPPPRSAHYLPVESAPPRGAAMTSATSALAPASAHPHANDSGSVLLTASRTQTCRSERCALFGGATYQHPSFGYTSPQL